MELVLDRKLSERRIFPAIDIPKTSTRREDLLLSAEEMEAINVVRRALNGMKSDEAVDKVLDLFAKLQFTRAIRNTIECSLCEHSIVMNRVFDALRCFAAHFLSVH